MDWKSIVSSIAPVLGTAFGGPLGGMAMSAVAKAVTGNESASEAQLSDALKNMTPETLAALKKVELDFQAEMDKHKIDLAALQFKDADSARNREIQVKDNTPKVLAALAVLGFCGIIGLVMFGWQPAEAMRDGFWMLVGAAIATYKDVYGYYFGSSSGSAAKTELLAKAGK